LIEKLKVDFSIIIIIINNNSNNNNTNVSRYQPVFTKISLFSMCLYRAWFSANWVPGATVSLRSNQLHSTCVRGCWFWHSKRNLYSCSLRGRHTQTFMYL